ncbi:unnamed protein product [Diabrotica balteata]|uniref:DUF4758 domain-containing protein n=1 Tax=Diabrotica balteata TaxID=107213 RepID=A0A9N9XH75_DIABA|nr:unnamed protein product [Diabrotica balteata]
MPLRENNKLSEVKSSSNEIASNNIIETKPITSKNEIKIKPTKTQSSGDKKSSQKVVSVVQVKSDPPKPASTAKPASTIKPSSKKEVKPSAVPKAAEKPKSTVNKAPVVDGAASTKLSATQSVITKVEIVGGSTKLAEPIIASKVESRKEPESSVVSSIVQVKSDNEAALVIGNNIGEPEYDFLSRQPSEVVEETFKVVNLKPSSKFLLKHRPATEVKKNAAAKRSEHPTGLVTKLGGTVVKDGVTTVIETSVIGTYISGKYAQVLQSTSRKINPTQSLRILKTAAPSLSKGNKQRQIDPTPAAAVNEETSSLPAENAIKSTRKSLGASGAYKRFKNRHKEPDVAVSEEDNDRSDAATAQPNYKKSQKNRSQSQNSRNSKPITTTHSQQKPRRNRNRKASTTSKPYVHREEPSTSSPAKRFSSTRKTKQSKTVQSSEVSSNNNNNNNNNGYSRRAFKPKVQPSSVDVSGSGSSSLYKFKLNRSPGRWQYKTTSKPRVTIRKQNSDEPGNNNETPGISSSPMPPSSGQEVPHTPINDVVTPQARSDDVDSLEESESIASIIDDESATANKLDVPAPVAFPVETIKVEISTPSDFGDIYYEIATIKSPYTFQVQTISIRLL